jgi:hypothetical protein
MFLAGVHVTKWHPARDRTHLLIRIRVAILLARTVTGRETPKCQALGSQVDLLSIEEQRPFIRFGLRNRDVEFQ